MGQKVHPYVLRLGINKNWRSLWYADRKEYTQNVVEDFKIRKYILKKFTHGAISSVSIERLGEQVKIVIATARPGIIVGRRGADILRLKEELLKIVRKGKEDIKIDTTTIENPALDAQLVAQNIAFQLEKRVAFRRAVKRAIDQSLQAGVLGLKVTVAGRLGGAEMARRERYHEGSLPLQTLRADIDYGAAEALTTYGLIGVKVWLYKGEIIPDKNKGSAQKVAVV